MEICCLCEEICEVGDSTSELRQKGVDSIKAANSSILCKVGDRVHKKCRLDLIRPKYVQKNPNSGVDATQKVNVINRRSKTPSFIPKEHCIFCGKGA